MNGNTTQIAPIGFEEDRATYGFLRLGADKIYLLVDSKEDEWGEEARIHAKNVKEKLQGVAFANNVIEKGYDPTHFGLTRETIKEVLEEERDTQRVYINISTSTKLCAIAAYDVAQNYENTILYYVVPEDYNIPIENKPFSSGAKRIEMFSPRMNIEFSEWRDKIMETLKEEEEVSSLKELNEILIPDDVSKASRAKLNYHLKKLKERGYITYERKSPIELTEFGENVVGSPTARERF